MRDGTVAATRSNATISDSSQSVAFRPSTPAFGVDSLAEMENTNCPSSNIPASRRDPGGTTSAYSGSASGTLSSRAGTLIIFSPPT